MPEKKKNHPYVKRMDAGTRICFIKQKYRPAYDKIGIESPSIVRHMKKILKFLEEEDGRDEQEKDIWTLKNFDFPIYRNPIKNTETINFTKIVQPDIREEVKK